MAPIIKITVVVGAICANELIVIHLGINPVNGGIPLKDRSRIGIIIWYMGEYEISLIELLLFAVCFLWKMMKSGQIIRE